MVRWYKGFNCTGIPPQVLVEQVAGIVRRSQLGNTIPVMRYEKRTGRSKSFYFFLAIESETIDRVPDNVQANLLQLASFRSPLPGGFALDQIRSMVSGELDVQDYARRMSYRVMRDLEDFDPFALPDSVEDPDPHFREQQQQVSEARTERYDRLLYWLSAVQTGSRGVFQRTCATLGLDKEGTQTSRILRRMRQLGHIELSRDGTQWSIAPTVLARQAPVADVQETGQTRVIVCGCRNPQLTAQLRGMGAVTMLPQPFGDGPATLLLTIDDWDHFWQALERSPQADQVYDGGQVGLRLAQALPPLPMWIEMLATVPGVTPQMYTVKQYRAGAFQEVAFTGQPGLYQLWPLEATRGETRLRLELLFHAATQTWRRGDWYGLRCAAQQLEGQPCAVKYYPTFFRLAIDAESRWPELYERTLTLASGQLPIRNGPWLIYEGISPELLQVLEQKINVEKVGKPLDA